MADFKITQIIEKKKSGNKFSKDDIQYFINWIVKSAKSNNGEEGRNIDRSQIGAMLMAIYLKGLDEDETSQLTEAMTKSGNVFSWPEKWKYLVVDKHSTGGVGDKVSLVLAPALASLGYLVPMISGRSLSHTGGTLDKLESIPGFRVSLSTEEIYEAIRTVGCCIVGQNEDCAPADKILYQCREVTATVTSPPLIVASIVSKKLTEGIECLVYDVKYGKGSVFSSKEEAEETARNLVQFSRGVKTSALLTSMENPLGRTVGNSVEVIEAIDCLKGKGPPDVLEITCALGSELLQLVRKTTKDEGRKQMMSCIKNGKALQKFKSMIIQQGVAEETAEELCYGDFSRVLPRAQYDIDVLYNGDGGYIQEIDPFVLAMIWKEELAKYDNHPGIGLTLLKVVGDSIKKGEPWVRIHSQTDVVTDKIQGQLKNAIFVGQYQKEHILIDKCLYLSEESILKEVNYLTAK